MRIDGKNPAAVQTMMAVAHQYQKTQPIYAIEAAQEGSIVTPEGEMGFAAGDMIASDVPPTHAWPIAREVFDRTYVRVPRPGLDDPGYPYGEFDAAKWADEFDRIFPPDRMGMRIGLDRGTMLGWFANAIMTGYDAARNSDIAHGGGPFDR